MKSSIPPASPVPSALPASDVELFAQSSSLRPRGITRLYIVYEGQFFSNSVWYTVQDEHGRGVYRIKGQLLRHIGTQLSLRDFADRELAQIRPRRYEVLSHGKTIAKFVPGWSPKLEVLGPNGYTIEVSWPKWVFFYLPWKVTARLLRDGRAIGLVAPSWVKMVDTEDPVMILALAWVLFNGRV